MSKKEFDLDEEVKRLARKTNVNLKKSEYSFNSQIRKLDNDIDTIMDKKIKEFDESKQVTSDYLNISFQHDTINRYREKLKKI